MKATKKTSGNRDWMGQFRVLSNMLVLVDRHAPVSVLLGWSTAQLKSAEKWAALTHLSASDNPVRVPKCPPHVQKLESASAVYDRLAAKRRGEKAPLTKGFVDGKMRLFRAPRPVGETARDGGYEGDGE